MREGAVGCDVGLSGAEAVVRGECCFTSIMGQCQAR